MPACQVRPDSSDFACANLSRGVHGFGVVQLISHRLSIGSLPWTPRRTHPATLAVDGSWFVRPPLAGSSADTGAMEPRSFPPVLIASSIWPVQSADAVSTTLSGSTELALQLPTSLKPSYYKPGKLGKATHAAFQHRFSPSESWLRATTIRTSCMGEQPWFPSTREFKNFYSRRL